MKSLLILSCMICLGAGGQLSPALTSAQLPAYSLQDTDPATEAGKTNGTAFYGVDLFTVTMLVQKITGKQFIFHTAPRSSQPQQPQAVTEEDLRGNYIYFVSDEDYSGDPDLFFRIYESLLEQVGFALLPVIVDKEKKVEIYKIIKIREVIGGRPGQMREQMLRDKPFPLIEDEDFAVRERVISRIFKLKYVTPSTIMSQLAQSRFTSTTIVPFDQEKILMMTDYDYNIKKFEKMIKLMDVKPVRPEMATIRLKYALATDVVEMLQGVLPAIFATGRAPVTRPPGTHPTNAPSTQQISDEGEYVAADNRTNSIVVVASKEKMELIKKIVIEDLDVDLPDRETVGMFVYRLTHLKANDAAQMVGQIMAGYFREQAPTIPTTPTTPPPTPTTPTTPSQPPQPVTVTGERFRVIPDPRTNSLIIVTDRNAYATIKQKVLDVLDKRTPQLLLKVTVVEITSGKDFDLAVELKRLVQARDSRFGFEYSHNFGLSTIEPPTDTNPFFNIVPVSTGTTGASAFLVRDRIGKIPTILKALETVAKGRILAEQELLTQNNQPAVFNDTRTTTVQVTDVQNIGGQAVQTTRPLEVQAVTTLNITPRISENMEVDLTLDFSTQRFGTAPGPNLPPDTTQRAINITNIRVTNTQTVVIGGATSEIESSSEQRVPLLSSIPLIGFLFRGSRESSQISRVYLFVTPYILYDDKGGDLVRHTQQREGLLRETDKDIRAVEYPSKLPDFKSTFIFAVPPEEE